VAAQNPDQQQSEAAQLYAERRIGDRTGMGRRPAVVVVDMSKAFCDSGYQAGDDVEPTLDAIATLLAEARRRGVPVFYVVMAFDSGDPIADAGVWGQKVPALLELVDSDSNVTTVHPRIAPEEGEAVMTKKRSSAFFGTGLDDLLSELGVDTLIVTGCSTSGCIRATALDAVSYDYRVVVPAECVADRAAGPHRANLFDMDAKYADVDPLASVIAQLEGL
jgi:maleamate amidohydrolase